MTEELGGNLLAAMEKYATLITQVETDPDVAEAKRVYDDLFEELTKAQEIVNMLQKKYRPQIEDLEEYIKAQVLELGLTARHAGVEAKHRKGYERVTWDNKNMTSLCMKNPALLEMLASARKVTNVEPSVTITYSTPEPEVEEIETPSEETPF